jgi:hypothetical protein
MNNRLIFERYVMLRSYPAQLQGTQVVWIDTPPPTQSQSQRVLVVIEEAAPQAARPSVRALLEQAKGSLGRLSRDKVLSQLVTLRDDWADNTAGR